MTLFSLLIFRLNCVQSNCSGITYNGKTIKKTVIIIMRGRVALTPSALDSGASGPGSSPGRGHCVVFLGSRHFTLTVPLSTQVYKWVPANCLGNLTNCGGVTFDGLASRPWEVKILLAASCYRNRDKLRQL